MKKRTCLLAGVLLAVATLAGCAGESVGREVPPAPVSGPSVDNGSQMPVETAETVSVAETTASVPAITTEPEPSWVPTVNNPTVNEDGKVVWNTLPFGNYYQSDDEEKEPVEWVVLETDGKTALVVSRYNLDAQYFDYADGSTDWKVSTLRNWLNSTFYSAAFSKQERSVILQKKLSTPGQKGKTKDRIFLLTAEDVWNEDYGFYDDSTRQCENTQYAEMQGAYTNEMGSGDWWLRSSYSEEGCLDYIKTRGEVTWHSSYSDMMKMGVRPAMYIDLAAYFQVHDHPESALPDESASEYIIEDSHLRYLKQEDLSHLDKKQLRLARNEIYARHGYKFRDKTLKKYFNSTDWYNGTLEADQFPDCLLNIFERENVRRISASESGKKYKASCSVEEPDNGMAESYEGEIELECFHKFCGKWTNGEKTINITPGEFNGNPYRLLMFEYNKFNDYYNIRLEVYKKSRVEFKDIITDSAFLQDGFSVITYDVNGHQAGNDGTFRRAG